MPGFPVKFHRWLFGRLGRRPNVHSFSVLFPDKGALQGAVRPLGKFGGFPQKVGPSGVRADPTNSRDGEWFGADFGVPRPGTWVPGARRPHFSFGWFTRGVRIMVGNHGAVTHGVLACKWTDNCTLRLFYMLHVTHSTFAQHSRSRPRSAARASSLLQRATSSGCALAELLSASVCFFFLALIMHCLLHVMRCMYMVIIMHACIHDTFCIRIYIYTYI